MKKREKTKTDIFPLPALVVRMHVGAHSQMQRPYETKTPEPLQHHGSSCRVHGILAKSIVPERPLAWADPLLLKCLEHIILRNTPAIGRSEFCFYSHCLPAKSFHIKQWPHSKLAEIDRTALFLPVMQAKKASEKSFLKGFPAGSA